MEHRWRLRYRYQPLISSSYVRLIHVHYAKHADDPIRISFSLVDLDDEVSTEYQTLSYTWGPTYPNGSHLTKVVLCGKRRLLVTPNLHDFLRHFRNRRWHKAGPIPLSNEQNVSPIGPSDAQISIYPSDGGRIIDPNDDQYSIDPNDVRDWPIWIDALSIDQNNMAERGQQVAMMASIYEKSKRLIIWLGEGTGLFPERSLSSAHANFDQAQIEAWITDEHGWFSRRWVIQELLLHSRASRSVWIGPYGLTWIRFVSALERSFVSGQSYPAHLIDTQPDTLKPDVCRGLLENLRRFDTTLCSDPRDLIFALLGISGDGHDIEIDYSVDPETLFSNIAANIIRSGDQNLVHMLLVSAITRNKTELRSKLPSWVPDWRDPITHVSLKVTNCAMQYPEYTGAPNMQPEGTFSATTKGDHLFVKGWLLSPDKTSSNLAEVRRSAHTCSGNAVASPYWSFKTALRIRQQGSWHELPRIQCPPCKLQYDEYFSLADEDKKHSLTAAKHLVCLWPKTRVAYVLQEHDTNDYCGKMTYRLDTCFPVNWVDQLGGWCNAATGGMTEIIIA